MAMKAVDTGCYAASGVMLAAVMSHAPELGGAGVMLGNVFTAPLGVAAYALPLWAFDEAYAAVFPRDQRTSLTRRFRWGIGTWLSAVAADLLGTGMGGWIGHNIGGRLWAAAGYAAYVPVFGGLYALARSCLPSVVDAVTADLSAIVVRQARELGTIYHRELAAVRAARALPASASRPQAPVVKWPSNEQTAYPVGFAASPAPQKRVAIKYQDAEIIDVPCEVVEMRSESAVVQPSLRNYRVPSLDVLSKQRSSKAPDTRELRRDAALIWRTLNDHGVIGSTTETSPTVGPSTVIHHISLFPGTKLSKLSGLVDELSLELGRPVTVVGNTVQVPRSERQAVTLRGVLESSTWRAFADSAALPVALGQSSTEHVTLDLAKAPHLLDCGETGSGKSVAINAMLCSLLLSKSPADIRILLIDPKRVELTAYRDIPHLLRPVATETSDAVEVLRFAVDEMERRYAALENARSRDIDSLGVPRIVLVVDEFADLSALSPEVMPLVQRLVQMARVAGIHLVIATQHPVKKVIDTVIKNNVPTRLCFRVASETASRLVLGEDYGDATGLQGAGDCFGILPGMSKPERFQGAFVSDEDVAAVTDACRSQGGPQYVEQEVSSAVLETASQPAHRAVRPAPTRDDLYERAVDYARKAGTVSIRQLQDALSVGFGKAQKLVARMDAEGRLGGSGPNNSRRYVGD